MALDKIILSNKTALQLKYGNNFKHIDASLKKLVKSDKEKGITSKVIWLDNKISMQVFKAPLVKIPGSAKQVKTSIDALYKKIQPSYIMIFGAPDIVPHVELRNMISDDDDQYVPSDLPYACTKKYSTRIADFLSPTRVIGRLPDIQGSSDYAYPVKLIENVIQSKPTTADVYKECFSLTAKVWDGSTAESLDNMFGNHSKLKNVPSTKGPYTATDLKPLIHFFNCHGSSVDDKFYGQQGDSYPIAFQSSFTKNKIAKGSLVAAECCFGAELYNPQYTEGALPISNSYLYEGALAFVGSTTVAYGPANGNGLADLITQYFIRNVQKGASLGRAMLDAHLRFLDKSAPHVDPEELKTAAQFILLGDPSVHLVKSAENPAIMSGSKSSSKLSKDNDRNARRAKLIAWGDALEKICKRPIQILKKRSIPKAVAAVLKENDVSSARGKSFAFSKTNSVQAKAQPTMHCHIFLDKKDNTTHKIKESTMLVIREISGNVMDVRKYERK